MHYTRMFAVLCVALVGACSSRRSLRAEVGVSPPQPGEAMELVGVWRLVEFWDRDSLTAPKRYQYGERPTGYFIYDAAGRVAIQFMRGPVVPVLGIGKGEDWFRIAPVNDLRTTIDSFRAYFGTYTVDRTRRVVVIDVQGDSHGLYTGTRQERQFRLVGDTLIIGNEKTWARVLIRVP